MPYRPHDRTRATNIALRTYPDTGGILDRIADDMRLRPEMMVPLSPALADRLTALTAGIEFDPFLPIEGAVDLSP